MRGGCSCLPLILLSALLLLASSSEAATPASAPSSAPSTGYNCSANRTIYPCKAYALYRAGVGTGPVDLPSVGDLFSVSRLMVARASNVTISTSNSVGQPLLVPLSCDCHTSTNRSYFPTDYQISSGETYYILSTTKFQNLTQYPAVEDVNPTLVPTDLPVGVTVTFPIFCQCPSNASSSLQGLVTYPVQPSDTYKSIAANFGTDVQSLTTLNGPEKSVKPYSAILVPMTKYPPAILVRNSSAAPAPSPTSPAAVVTVTKDRNGAVIGLSVALGVVALIGSLLVVVVVRRRRRGDARAEERGEGMRKGSGRGAMMGEEKLVSGITEWLDKYRVFTVEELRRVTKDFGESSLIEGTVYKGVVDGEVFAVKKMKWDAREELKILQKVNHTNLVKLEGFCIDSASGTCYLVYEYVENGSLDGWLHDRESARKLDWRARLRIALDLAYGLQYIHEHTWPRVVHKDIKSSNVLLDAKLRAKIANFGLAKTGTNAVTTHIVGTQGYIAPEYLSDGLVTTKMDVFAYGVVLLELVSGKEAVSEEGEALWSEAEEFFREKSWQKEAKVREWVDEALAEQSLPVESVVCVMEVARVCLQQDPSKRPSMVEVAYTLSRADESFGDYSGDGLSFEGGADVAGR